jgi:hypothetical protein
VLVLVGRCGDERVHDRCTRCASVVIVLDTDNHAIRSSAVDGWKHCLCAAQVSVAANTMMNDGRAVLVVRLQEVLL